MSNNNQNQDSRGKLLPWALAAIVGLAGTNIYTWVNKGTVETEKAATTTALEQKTVQLTESETSKAALQQTYDAALVELEAKKGKNAELNALIDRQKAEIKKKAGRITELMKTAEGLKLAQGEIESLKAQISGFIVQIDDLNKKNQELGKNVATLTADKTSLQQDIQKAKADIEVVKTEKTQVEAEKKALNSQVEAGSVVTIGNFSEMQGFAVRESGKEKKKKWAENIQRLKFTFDITENRIAKNGKETFFFRVIDPTGVAVAVQSGGAGVIKLNDGKEVQYTFAKEVDYNGQKQTIDVTWDPGVALQRGNYTFEVYNKGFSAGKHTVMFKK
ncbi:MAG: hypothetical protein RL757_35 [Bacteroidota bacterium]|jgi:hypothetical protein